MRVSFAGFALYLLLASPAILAQGAGSTNNTITTSTSSSRLFHTTNAAVDVNNYLTRLTARIGSGSLLYDQTFSVQLSDATVQAAIQQARTQLTNAGAVSIAGPTLQTNVRTLTGTSQSTVVDGTTNTQTVTLEDTIGPGTIIIGDRDNGGTAFQVLAGTANLNINTHTQTDIFQTLTTTSNYLTAQTYELVGVTSPGGSATSGSMAQIATSGGWDTLITLVNLGASSATGHADFFGDTGSPLSIPLNVVPVAASVSAALTTTPTAASSFDQALNANASVVIDATGSATQAPVVGWSRMQSAGAINGFGIFRFPQFRWEAVVPLEIRNAPRYVLAFDNTGSLATGLAVANLSGSAANIPVIIRDDAGAQIFSATINLSGQGHTSFMLNAQYEGTKSKRGTIEFTTPQGGQISVLGLQANGPALTTLPVLASSDTPGGSIAHATYNGGFNSSFYLVNTGSASASFTLNFFDESGKALNVPLSLPQSGTNATTSALTRTLAPGAMLVVETVADDAAASIVGSAQLTTTGSVSGFEIFKWTTFGQEASVPLETRTPGSFVLVFDNTGGLTTGVALSNIAATGANVTAKVYDDAGNLLQTSSINLVGRGHTSFLLPSSYAVTANRRGMVEFVVPAGGKINAVGLRAKADGTLTTIPVLTR